MSSQLEAIVDAFDAGALDADYPAWRRLGDDLGITVRDGDITVRETTDDPEMTDRYDDRDPNDQEQWR